MAWQFHTDGILDNVSANDRVNVVLCVIYLAIYDLSTGTKAKYWRGIRDCTGPAAITIMSGYTFTLIYNRYGESANPSHAYQVSVTEALDRDTYETLPSSRYISVII